MEEIDTTPIKPEKVKKSLSEAQIKNMARMRELKKMKSEVKKFMVNNNMPLPEGETLGYKKKKKENTIDKLDNIQQNKENLPNQNNPIVKNSDEMKYDNDIIKKINDILIEDPEYLHYILNFNELNKGLKIIIKSLLNE